MPYKGGGIGSPIVLRFVLPAEPSAPLTMRAPDSLLSLEVWHQGQWCYRKWIDLGYVAEAPRACPGEATRRFIEERRDVEAFSKQLAADDEMRDYAVPYSRSRVVYVRVDQPYDNGHSHWAFTLREQA